MASNGYKVIESRGFINIHSLYNLFLFHTSWPEKYGFNIPTFLAVPKHLSYCSHYQVERVSSLKKCENTLAIQGTNGLWQPSFSTWQQKGVTWPGSSGITAVHLEGQKGGDICVHNLSLAHSPPSTASCTGCNMALWHCHSFSYLWLPSCYTVTLRLVLAWQRLHRPTAVGS